MSTINVGNVAVGGMVIWSVQGRTAPLVTDADGIITIGAFDGSSAVVANGEVVRGIKVDYGDPLLTVDTQLDEWQSALVILRAEVGGSFAVEHMAAGVSAEQQIAISSGSTAYVDDRRIQVFSEHDGVSRHWRMPDWAPAPISVAGPYTDDVDAASNGIAVGGIYSDIAGYARVRIV